MGERSKKDGKVKKDQFALWLKDNPSGTFKEFYAESVTDALLGKKSHASLGPKLTTRSIDKARRVFDEVIAQRIRPSDTLVEYGCGTLRLGMLLIEFLEPDRYIGLDIDERILASGRSRLPTELVASKRPVLKVISPESVRDVAAKQPRWVCSKGVIRHVAPTDLDEYFENLSCLVHAGATGLLSARLGPKSEQIATKTWVYDFGSLQIAAARHGMKLEPRDDENWMRLRRFGPSSLRGG
jgi:cyclopropane fatty-acyl-phospholipid synthase-like methyltransferase